MTFSCEFHFSVTWLSRAYTVICAHTIKYGECKNDKDTSYVTLPIYFTCLLEQNTLLCSDNEKWTNFVHAVNVLSKKFQNR